MAKAESLLSAQLLGKTGNVDAESIKAKHLGLYFSAHWCPPCRGFTPILADFYKKVQAQYGEDFLEIVFISSDRDEASFNEYYEGMPWIALPYAERKGKDELAKKYGVSGIPKFVLLNGEDGKVLMDNARSDVQRCQEDVKQFPWI